jgi:hypothetical protein
MTCRACKYFSYIRPDGRVECAAMVTAERPAQYCSIFVPNPELFPGRWERVALPAAVRMAAVVAVAKMERRNRDEAGVM